MKNFLIFTVICSLVFVPALVGVTDSATIKPNAAPSTVAPTPKTTPTPNVTSTKVIELKKDDITKQIKQISVTTFGGTPIFKYKIKDSLAWNALLDTIKNFIVKNSSDDKVLKTNLAAIAGESSAILNATKIVYGSVFSTKTNITDADKKLFEPYSTAKATLEKAKKALTDETYVMPGKRDSRALLVEYAQELLTIVGSALQAFKTLSPATPTPVKNTTKKITLYNNTKDKVLIKIATSEGTREVNLDPEKLSSDIQVGPSTATTFVKSITIKPSASSTLGSGSVSDQSLNAADITALNTTLKSVDSSKFTLITDGKSYSLKTGQITISPKGFIAVAKSKQLILRNKTQNKLRINLVNSAGKEITISMSCSTADTALHSVTLPADAQNEYIKALYISSIPISADKLATLNQMLASKIDPLFDIRLNEDKNKVLWQYFINQAPD